MEIGEEKLFFCSKAFCEDDWIQKNIFRTLHGHDDSERKIINQGGEKKIELSYGSWVNSKLNRKYEDLQDLNKARRKRILYSYSEIKEAIIYFAKNRKRNSSFERLLDEYFDKVYKKTW